MAIRVQCPFCSKAHELQQAPTLNQRLLCTGCARSFSTTFAKTEAIPAAVSAPAASAPAPDWALNAPQAAGPVAKPASPRKAPPPPPATLPSSVLRPITPPPSRASLKPVPPPPAPASAPLAAEESDAPAQGPRRGLLVGVIVGGLLLLIGSTILAVALASRVDRHKRGETVARNDSPPSDSLQRDTRSKDGTTTQRNSSGQPFNDDSPPAPRRDKDDQSPRRNDFPPPPLIETKLVPVHQTRSNLPPELQEEVNKAIDKGVAHLKKTQLASGSWEPSRKAGKLEHGYTVGMAALPGLTLLECGVKPDDPVIQKAARFVRDNVMSPTITATYECSLALLFLDRLGDPKDKPLIRTLALRLVAGQLRGGGWTYGLPDLSAQEERELMEFLEQTRPERNLDFMVRNNKDKLDSTIKSDERKSLDAYYEALEAKKNDKGGNVKEMDSEPKRAKSLSQEEAKKAFDKLPTKVRNAPAVSGPVTKEQPKVPLFGAGDNSNTQFAMLALWAARRHDLPLERALDAVGKRFRDSQSNQGTWGYGASVIAGGSPAMTGAGLLGLAVGHGSATDPNRKFKVKDPQIDKGLKALGQNVGKPFGPQPKKNDKGKVVVRRHNTPINLYFLWTVERVGVLYDVSELDGKDWYLWGVELLLPVQNAEGSWQQGGYHNATKNVDTSFALLFLKRANLAQDLTQRLDFVVEGKPTR